MTMIKDKLDELINNATKSGNVNARRILKLFKAELIDYTLREIKDSDIPLPEGVTSEELKEYIIKKKKEMRTVTESVEVDILQKMIKKLNDELAYAIRLNRTQIIDDVKSQISVLTKLLPPPPTEEEIIEYLDENFPYGFTKKEIKYTINAVKEKFMNADGSAVAKLCIRLAK
jgi:YqeY-like protein